MSDFESRTIGSFLKRLIPVVALAIFTAPSASYAEPLLLLHNEVWSLPVPEIARKTVKPPLNICLDEKGDLVIRHSDVSLALAYTPSNVVFEPQERLTIAQRMVCPTTGGIFLKVSFLF